jgi:hypothetical protein
MAIASRWVGSSTDTRACLGVETGSRCQGVEQLQRSALVVLHRADSVPYICDDAFDR